MPDVPPELAAAFLPRYCIERELGIGGMATVYLARDVRHERDVAIKVLNRELADVIGADRFIAEIRTTAHLRHPKAYDAQLQTSIWSVSVDGGQPQLLVAFDDPARRSLRREFATDGHRFYFTIASDESDLSAVELISK